MIQENLQNMHSSEWFHAKSIKREIRGLTVEKLHKINDSEKIINICFEVMQAIERCLLVHVDEHSLESRKLKKDKNKPLTYTEYEVNKNAANIRSDWASKKWGLPSLPYGYIFRKRETILGIIYKTESNTWYRTFVDKRIANNPHGSSLLISEMKKRQMNMK